MSILITERLILRKFCYDDWKDLYEYLSKETVVKYEPYDICTEDSCKREATKRSLQDSFWAVCLKENNKLIGNVYFEQQEPKKCLTWEIDYTFNPMYYGKGYATESCREILRYGFQQLHINRIISMCNPRNTASSKLLERLNMRKEGHLQSNMFLKYNKNKKPIRSNIYQYALLAKEWVDFIN